MEKEEMFASLIESFYCVLEISHDSITVGDKVIYAEYSDKYCELNTLCFNSEEEAFNDICADEMRVWIKENKQEYLESLTDDQIVFLKKYFKTNTKMPQEEIDGINALVDTMVKNFIGLHIERLDIEDIDREINKHYDQINIFKKTFGFETNTTFDVVIAYAQYIEKLNYLKYITQKEN